MMSIQNKLRAVRDALVGVTDKCYHYRRPPAAPKSNYIIWAEDSEDGSFDGDNRKQEQQIHGTVDYFTLKEFDPMVDAIQEALLIPCAGYRLNSVQYEDDTNLIHYEWEFWVV